MYEVLLTAAMIVGANPTPAPVVVERTEESQLGSLLATWEAQSNRGEVIQIEFTRIVYDDVFKVEKRSTGRLILGDGKYRVALDPSEIEEGERSPRDGYKLRAGRAETWVQNATNTLWIKHSSRCIDDFVHRVDTSRVAVAQKPTRSEPEPFFRFRFPSFWDDYVPAILRVQPEHLRRQYRINLQPHIEKQTIVKLIPRGEPESSYWKSLVVLWDHEKGRVHALRITDPTGNLETVYVVNSYEIDPILDWDSIWNPEYPDYSVKIHQGR